MAVGKLQGIAGVGGVQLTTSGVNSTQKAVQTFPLCTVTVYQAGTVNLATIYSDALLTPKANPFTASSDASWFFYAATGSYDIQFSGTGIAAPFTLGDVLIPGASANNPGGSNTELQYRASASSFGASSLKYNATTGAVQLTTPTINSGTLATAFGDSITKGTTGPTTLANSYAQLVATAKNWTLTNTAVDGTMIPDITSLVYGTTVGTNNTQYWLAIGTNDQRIFNGDGAKLQAFKDGHAALLAFLALPSDSRFLGTDTTNITYAGTWANSAAWGVSGPTRGSINAPGSTATWKANGTTLYIGTLVQRSSPVTGNQATFSLTVDGVNMGTFSSDPTFTITTNFGKTYTPRLIRLNGLSEGEHTVVLTVLTAATASDAVYIDWVGGNGGVGTGGVRQLGGPSVYTMNIPRFTSAGYVANGGSDALVYSYSAAIRANVNALQSDGLNVALIDVLNTLNPLTDLIGDGVHINDAGNVKYKNAALAVMNSIALPRERQASASVPRGIFTEPSSATPIFNFALSPAIAMTLTANVTAVTYRGLSAGDRFTVRLTQGGAGSYTFAWGSSVKWVGGTAPTLSTTVGKIDIFHFISPDGVNLEEISRALDVR